MVKVVAGIQDVSTIDYPGELSTVLFTRGCNLNCFYCFNKDICNAREEQCFSDREVFDSIAKNDLIDAVVITGGEPTLHLEWLTEFLPKIKEIGLHVKLDTNGLRPFVLHKLISLKLLDYIAMDLKTSPCNYIQLGAKSQEDLDHIIESVNIVKSFSNREFRTTIVYPLSLYISEFFPMLKGEIIYLQDPILYDVPKEVCSRGLDDEEIIDLMHKGSKEGVIIMHRTRLFKTQRTIFSEDF